MGFDKRFLFLFIGLIALLGVVSYYDKEIIIDDSDFALDSLDGTELFSPQEVGAESFLDEGQVQSGEEGNTEQCTVSFQAKCERRDMTVADALALFGYGDTMEIAKQKALENCEKQAKTINEDIKKCVENNVASCPVPPCNLNTESIPGQECSIRTCSLYIIRTSDVLVCTHDYTVNPPIAYCRKEPLPPRGSSYPEWLCDAGYIAPKYTVTCKQ